MFGGFRLVLFVFYACFVGDGDIDVSIMHTPVLLPTSTRGVCEVQNCMS